MTNQMMNQNLYVRPAPHPFTVPVRGCRLTRFKGRMTRFAPSLAVLVVAVASVLFTGGVAWADDEFLAGDKGNPKDTGGTMINKGTLQVADGGSIAGDVTNNRALTFTPSGALTYGDDISGKGTLTKSGTGPLILTGANAHSGGTTIAGGTLQIKDSGGMAGDITNNRALTFTPSGTLAYDNVISGSASLERSGESEMTMTGANTYTRGTTVTDSLLIVTGRSGKITVNGGALGGTGTVRANSGATLAPGSSIGTLDVDGDVTFTSDSKYEAEVDRDGNADMLDAVGTTTIGDGASVHVTAGEGTDSGSTYVPATNYTILTANDGGSAFSVTGVPIDQDTTRIETDLKANSADGVFLSASYNGEPEILVQDHGFNAKISARF